MLWALAAVLLDQTIATLAVAHGWAHPNNQRLLHFIPYALQLLLGVFFLVRVWRFKSTASFLIVGGWLSNALSFTRFGFVPDYLPIHLGKTVLYNNGADLFISIGAIWLIAKLFMKREQP